MASQPMQARQYGFIKKPEKALSQADFSKNPVISFSVLRAKQKRNSPSGCFFFCWVMRTTSVARWVSEVKTPWAWRFDKRCLPKREFWKSGLPRAQNDTRRRRARSDNPKVMWFKSLSPAGSVTVRL